MLERLANWGEFVGGVAVVISLIYLAIQVRSSVRQARVDSYTSVTQLWGQFTSIVGAEEETWRIYYQGTKDFDSLSEEEKARFNFIIGMYFGIVDTIMVHEAAGAFRYPETYQRCLDQAYAIFSQPGAQAWWRRGKGRMFAPKVEEYLLKRRESEGSSG